MTMSGSLVSTIGSSPYHAARIRRQASLVEIFVPSIRNHTFATKREFCNKSHFERPFTSLSIADIHVLLQVSQKRATVMFNLLV